MIGILLVAVGEIFGEISTSLGKREVARKKESLYAFGFLNAFWATLAFVIIGLMSTFTFSVASLPTFGIKVVLEIVMMFVTIFAVNEADRSTFTFLRILTIPLLVVVDLALGIVLSQLQLIGMALIVVTIAFFAYQRNLSRKGKLLSLASACIAVATISLFKYNITYYNSIAAEQAITYIILLMTLVVTARVKTRENVFLYLIKPRHLVQSFFAGIASVLINYALLFGPASVIMTATRTGEVLVAVVS